MFIMTQSYNVVKKLANHHFRKPPFLPILPKTTLFTAHKDQQIKIFLQPPTPIQNSKFKICLVLSCPKKATTPC